ncbi:hypothetical protein [Paenibacillus sp. L3-i20]|uniref:hypothetical protein n=1 Tax=Paenibacillus sp. L3-i20 TaxID=2905833 RepID=UPI001EE11631|nr:hypothetical protein [Paenibacillus sp. L3-i20]GKU78473.1 hypothetical protein L3i20_v228700 [Paenibacillus sp. L3-i20]
MRKIFGFIVVCAVLQLLFGCTGSSKQRSPEEWLSLSYSGLAAMDQYAFTGSLSIGIGEGAMLKPQTFEGKIVNHHQLTLQSEGQDHMKWNPVNILKSLKESNEKVEIIKEGTEKSLGADIIVLHVWEDAETAKLRWKKTLTEQLDQLTGNNIIAGSATSNSYKTVIEQSRNELNNMLNSLMVDSQYDLIIDKKKLIPLKMDERTAFSYFKNGQQANESRHTMIRFQSFDGSATEDAISPKS